MAPVDVLPTELLMEIFVWCSTASEHALTPIILTRVCKYWRTVVLGLPRAWQSLFLDDKQRSIANCRLQAETWARRSAPLFFDVELNLHELDMLLPMLSPLLPEFRRWRGFIMTGVREESVQLTSLCNFKVYHPMQHVRIVIDDPDEDFDTGIALGGTFVKCHGEHQISMQFAVVTLPQPALVVPLRITSLDIGESLLNHELQPVHLLEFLTACPELESLQYTGWPRDTEYNERTPPVVSLPRLHTLHLLHTCAARTILSHIDAPVLRKLILAHLNVHFLLHDVYNEEGDSEDEAQDFSQSPSSDQATGMGLRKLITRCNPPIEVLEMDYSDLRTKDFRWCFDRLHNLRSFRIVASDMSDRVIDLFRPFREPGDVDVSAMRVRLPKLESLRLVNCQRFSGDVLANAFGTRVKYTDRVTPESTLKDVSIADCVGFMPWNEAVLRKELGARLRI